MEPRAWLGGILAEGRRAASREPGGDGQGEAPAEGPSDSQTRRGPAPHRVSGDRRRTCVSSLASSGRGDRQTRPAGGRKQWGISRQPAPRPGKERSLLRGMPRSLDALERVLGTHGHCKSSCKGRKRGLIRGETPSCPSHKAGGGEDAGTCSLPPACGSEPGGRRPVTTSTEKRRSPQGVRLPPPCGRDTNPQNKQC